LIFFTTDCRFWIIYKPSICIFTEINKYTFNKNKNIRELTAVAKANNIVLIAETDNEHSKYLVEGRKKMV
jgi:hypothetical protein